MSEGTLLTASPPIHQAKEELEVHDMYMNLVLGCGVNCGTALPPAQRSVLRVLRGDVNTEARMLIARCLGVRVGVALRGVRRLRADWDWKEARYLREAMRYERRSRCF